MIVCPSCGNARSGVIETRSTAYGARRRRECSRCLTRFTTVEIATPMPASARRLAIIDAAQLETLRDVLARIEPAFVSPIEPTNENNRADVPSLGKPGVDVVDVVLTEEI